MIPRPVTLTRLSEVVLLMADDENLSYRDACKQAGVSYRTAYRHLGCLGRWGLGGKKNMIPDEVIHAELRKADKELGRPATTQDFYRGRGISHNTVYRRYGSWDAGRIAAGLEPIRWRERGCPARGERS